MQPRRTAGRASGVEALVKAALPRLLRGWNNRRSFLFPSVHGPIISGRRVLASVVGMVRLGLLLQARKMNLLRARHNAVRGRVLSAKDEPTDTSRKKKRGSGDGVSDSLRSAYERTLNEEIPPDMLDLLGKLG